jgi:flavodoxin
LKGAVIMKKNIIIYASKHHNNTYKLVKAISEKYEITTIDATKETIVDLHGYELIGFASGIDFGKFYEEIENFAKTNLPIKKKVFFLYTCAMERKEFTNSMKEIVLEKEADILGEYGCKGYNTYGPWKVIGGMNKKHPTEIEIMSAVEFFDKLYGDLNL